MFAVGRGAWSVQNGVRPERPTKEGARPEPGGWIGWAVRTFYLYRTGGETVAIAGAAYSLNGLNKLEHRMRSI